MRGQIGDGKGISLFAEMRLRNFFAGGDSMNWRSLDFTRICLLGSLAAVLFATGSLLGGCGGSDGVPVHQTQGRVLLDGEPAEGAFVKFLAVNPSAEAAKLRPLGRVDAEGRYTLATYGYGDGAPEGEYGVIVSWPTPDELTEPGTFPENWEDLWYEYADRDNPKFHVVIKPEENTIPTFELHSPEVAETDADTD